LEAPPLTKIELVKVYFSMGLAVIPLKAKSKFALGHNDWSRIIITTPETVDQYFLGDNNV
jgi:hypothetical protein